MASKTKPFRRVAIHGSAEERQAAFERLLAENAQSLCYRYVENGDGTSTVTTYRNGKVTESVTHPSEHLRPEVRPAAPRFINNILGDPWREQSA